MYPDPQLVPVLLLTLLSVLHSINLLLLLLSLLMGKYQIKRWTFRREARKRRSLQHLCAHYTYALVIRYLSRPFFISYDRYHKCWYYLIMELYSTFFGLEAFPLFHFDALLVWLVASHLELQSPWVYAGEAPVGVRINRRMFDF